MTQSDVMLYGCKVGHCTTAKWDIARRTSAKWHYVSQHFRGLYDVRQQNRTYHIVPQGDLQGHRVRTLHGCEVGHCMAAKSDIAKPQSRTSHVAKWHYVSQHFRGLYDVRQQNRTYSIVPQRDLQAGIKNMAAGLFHINEIMRGGGGGGGGGRVIMKSQNDVIFSKIVWRRPLTADQDGVRYEEEAS